MDAWTVLFTATASEHVETIGQRWAANREAAPTLFIDDLSAATERLSRFPGSGAPFKSTAGAGLRRVLLPRCRSHVYYTVHPDPPRSCRSSSLARISRRGPGAEISKKIRQPRAPLEAFSSNGRLTLKNGCWDERFCYLHQQRRQSRKPIVGKVYRTLSDSEARANQMIRVVDEDRSEPDGYLYPSSMFAPIEVPDAAKPALMTAGD